MKAHFIEEAFTPIRRAVSKAVGKDKIAAFRNMTSEVPKWITQGYLDKATAVDVLHDIMLGIGIDEQEIQVNLAAVFAGPADRRIDDDNEAEPPKTNGAKTASLVVRQASTITPEPITWLWPARIAVGKLTLIAGEPGFGKSQLACGMAAEVTNGDSWPNGEGRAPLGSVVMSAEDDAADTIRPRLDAAGADVDRVYVVSAVRVEDGKGRRAFNLQVDLELLAKEIERIGDVRLVVIDPVSSYLGKVDSHKNAELRAVLEPIGELASRLSVAVVAITHLNKSGAGGANNRFTGSIAFVAAARAAFIVCRDPADKERRLFLPTKNNVGPEGSGLGFRVGVVVTASGIPAPTIFWDSMPVNVSADEVLNSSKTSGDSAPVRTQAEGFLRELLADGAMPSKRIRSEAREAGIAWGTIRRAKDVIGVIVEKTGLDGGWSWSLPQQREDAHR